MKTKNKLILFSIFLIFLLFLIIITFSINYNSNNSRENFNNTNTSNTSNKSNTFNIILLGDSILANENYVINPSKNSVYSQLKEALNLKSKKSSNQSYTIYCYAEDNAFINDVYNQLNKLNSQDLNQSQTNIIILSIGGNDLINQTKTKLKQEYKLLIKSIQEKFPNSKLIICDIYYPKSSYYNQFNDIIKNWNNFLSNLINQQNNENYSSNIIYLPLSILLTENSDFINSIEPSISGSTKIINELIKLIN